MRSKRRGRFCYELLANTRRRERKNLHAPLELEDRTRQPRVAAARAAAHNESPHEVARDGDARRAHPKGRERRRRDAQGLGGDVGPPRRGAGGHAGVHQDRELHPEWPDDVVHLQRENRSNQRRITVRCDSALRRRQLRSMRGSARARLRHGGQRRRLPHERLYVRVEGRRWHQDRVGDVHDQGAAAEEHVRAREEGGTLQVARDLHLRATSRRPRLSEAPAA